MPGYGGSNRHKPLLVHFCAYKLNDAVQLMKLLESSFASDFLLSSDRCILKSWTLALSLRKDLLQHNGSQRAHVGCEYQGAPAETNAYRLRWQRWNI